MMHKLKNSPKVFWGSKTFFTKKVLAAGGNFSLSLVQASPKVDAFLSAKTLKTEPGCGILIINRKIQSMED